MSRDNKNTITNKQTKKHIIKMSALRDSNLNLGTCFIEMHEHNPEIDGGLDLAVVQGISF